MKIKHKFKIYKSINKEAKNTQNKSFGFEIRIFLFLFGHEYDFSDIFESFIDFDECSCERWISNNFLNFGQEGLVCQVFPHVRMAKQFLKNSFHVLILILRDL